LNGPKNRGAYNFTDNNTGFAVGYYGIILKTINSGSHWDTLRRITHKELQSVYFLNSNIGYAVGNYGTIIKTINGGTDWTKISFTNTTDINLVHFLDVNKGFVVGGEIYKTADGGSTWTTISATNNQLFSAYFVSENIIYGVGYPGLIIKTSDGGATWTTLNSGTATVLNSSCFLDENTGYVIGRTGTILKTTDGGGFPVGLTPDNSAYNFLKIYPNPSSNTINIETSKKSCNCNLFIFNISGQQVLQRAITGSKTTIDVSALLSGIYFVKVVSGNAVQVGKFIKE